MNNLITTLEIIRFISAIALCVALFALAIYGLYRNIKETAETAIREELEQAIKETARPVVKIEIQTREKWYNGTDIADNNSRACRHGCSDVSCAERGG